MAAAALTPRVRAMVICDGIRPSRVEEGVFHLQGVRNHITATSFPFIPRRLWLYLVLSSPRKGRYPGYIKVIDNQTDQMISYRLIEPAPDFHEGLEFLQVPVPLVYRFPRPGRYLI
jgi:hypothetical protein